ncbi:MAG: type II toxin-antitoxin system VapC family toxin [Sphingobacteriaceae bacterium]|nr:MAG: type II toxin-antitoxin system VapC family toxin [Sphingobacteriaceae bacterium]
MCSCNVVPIDSETAKIYATIKNKLLKKGKPIPENDIWIAAVAIRYELPLVAFDKHFLEIENLQLEV